MPTSDQVEDYDAIWPQYLKAFLNPSTSKGCRRPVDNAVGTSLLARRTEYDLTTDSAGSLIFVVYP